GHRCDDPRDGFHRAGHRRKLRRQRHGRPGAHAGVLTGEHGWLGSVIQNLWRWVPPSHSQEGHMSAHQGASAAAQLTLVAPAATTSSPAAARPRRLALRVTLQVLLLGLLLATVVAVGGVDYVSSQLLTEEQTEQFLSATSLAVSSDVEAAFAPSASALRELQGQAE